MITLTILGDPKALKRHRTVTRARDGKPLPFAREYDPSAKDKQDLAVMAQAKAPEKLLDGSLLLEIVAVFQRPKNHYRTGKHAGELKDDAPLWHTSRPDVSNIQKFVEDALNGVWWTDDCKIVASVAYKLYGRPKTVIRVITTDEDWLSTSTVSRLIELVDQEKA